MSILNTIDRTVARTQRVSAGTRLDGFKSIGIDTADIDLAERSTSLLARRNLSTFDVPCVKVGDASFSAVTMQETVSLISLLVQKGNAPHHIVTGNLDHLYRLIEVDQYQLHHL